VWKDMEDNLGKHAIWNEASIEGRLKIWFVRSKLKSLRVTPFLVIWEIWIAINSILFEY